MNSFGIIFLLFISTNQVICIDNYLLFSSGDPSLSMEKSRRYCNDWAVEIHGGSEMADHIARQFGFTNLGQVKKDNVCT